MTSDHLKQECSLEELDALLEQDRITAAKTATTVFAYEVSASILNINKIN